MKCEQWRTTTENKNGIEKYPLTESMYSKILVLLLTLVLAGCPFDDDDDNDTSVASDSEQNVVLSLNIVDENGASLSDTLVSSTTTELLSKALDSNSRLRITVNPSDEAAILRIEKTGYESALLYLPNTQSNVTQNVMLKERQPAISVNIDSGGDFSGLDGARVVVGASSFVRADGSVATGQVELFINTVDTTDSDELESFPGSFLGLASADTEPGILASLGVSSYSFEQNGEKLQLREGEVAQLTMPLYAGSYEDGTPIPLGDLIPIWRLNEQTGIWEEESTGVVVAMPSSPSGLGLQGSTSHFSSFNADIWGRNSSGLGGQSGPAGQTRNLPQTCIVSVNVPEFEDATRYNARVVMNLGVLASTRPISGIYYEPFSFPVFQGRPASLRLSQPEFNNNEGRSLVQSFTCTSDTLDLLVMFEAVPAFFSVEARAEPHFDLVNGQQEVTKNSLGIRSSFINDADDTAQVTTNFGYSTDLVTSQTRYVDVFPSDPSPLRIAYFLENALGDADTQLLVDYVAEAIPRVSIAYANNIEEVSTFTWSGVEGADTLSIYEYDLGTDQLGVIIRSNIIATSASGSVNDIGFQLPAGWYMMIFENQYGITEVPVFLSESDECLPNSDLPCAA